MFCHSFGNILGYVSAGGDDCLVYHSFFYLHCKTIDRQRTWQAKDATWSFHSRIQDLLRLSTAMKRRSRDDCSLNFYIWISLPNWQFHAEKWKWKKFSCKHKTNLIPLFSQFLLLCVSKSKWIESSTIKCYKIQMIWGG